MINGLKGRGVSDKRVIVGGVIPDEDAEELKKQGVAEVFPVGTNINEMVKSIKSILEEKG